MRRRRTRGDLRPPEAAPDSGVRSSPFEPDHERSADLEPTIQSTEDLERITSSVKPSAHEGLSEEARRQIEPKLLPKKGSLPKKAA